MGIYGCRKCRGASYTKAGKLVASKGINVRIVVASLYLHAIRESQQIPRTSHYFYTSVAYPCAESQRRYTGFHVVYRWILEYSRADYEKPTSQGEAVVVEIHEM